jgi:hypothetical protein
MYGIKQVEAGHDAVRLLPMTKALNGADCLVWEMKALQPFETSEILLNDTVPRNKNLKFQQHCSDTLPRPTTLSLALGQTRIHAVFALKIHYL